MNGMDLMEREEAQQAEEARLRKYREILDRVVREDMTEHQRQTFLAYHVQGLTMAQIAAQQSVCHSTVCRTLRRAEAKLNRVTKYIRMT